MKTYCIVKDPMLNFIKLYDLTVECCERVELLSFEIWGNFRQRHRHFHTEATTHVMGTAAPESPETR